ncbi:MAG TPA: ImmA/IrrE family metallo-endopeptidase [Roseococcus sp.]|nr:ImmA/IrrE family metallo-endopeptidase [Roseococcus sp.]
MQPSLGWTDLAFGGPRPVLVKPLAVARRSVEAVAEDTRRRLGLAPGAALEGAVAELGGRILRGGPHLRFCGQRLAYAAEAQDRFEIRLLAPIPREQERLDVAHALGHHVLHDPALRERLGSAILTAAPAMARPQDEDGQRADLEAFWFAHQLLMPEALFRASWADQAHDISVEDRLHRLGTLFGVPTRSAEVRAERLGLQRQLQAA